MLEHKVYLKKGFYPAPKWFMYPYLPYCSSEWNIGPASHYSLEYLKDTGIVLDEFEKLFPKPMVMGRILSKELFNNKDLKVYVNKFNEGLKRSLLTNLWSFDGKPKYSFDDFHKVSDIFIINNTNFDLYKEFGFKISHTYYSSVFQCLNRIKANNIKDSQYSENINYSISDEELWDRISYTVCLNINYFKVFQNKDLKNSLLATDDKILVFLDNSKWGISSNDFKDFDDGKDIQLKDNLLGFALMEVRDEIKRVSKNEHLIDWDYSNSILDY